MTTIIIPVLIFIGLGAAMGVLLSVAARAFAMKVDEKAEAISECLPSANCGGCGYAGCSALAEAISKGEASVNACTAGGAEVAEKIAAIMGVEAGEHKRMRAQVMCSGANEYVKKKYIYEGIPDCTAAARSGGGENLCPNGCIGLGSCVNACPFGAITVVSGVAVVDYTRCTGCGVCTHICPKKIIQLIPFDSKHWVGCSSTDEGKRIRKYCDVGCISCKICQRNCEAGAIKVDEGIAVIEYDKCTGCDVCVDKCPRKIIWSGERQGKLGLVITRIADEPTKIV